MSTTRISRRTVLGGIGAGALLAAVPGTRSASAATTLAWLSGAGDPIMRNVTGGGFGAWRGEPCTYARIWADSSLTNMTSVWGIDPFTSSGWSGVLDIACGGPRDGLTWRDAAEGRMDDVWNRTLRKVYAGWGNLQSVHLSMSHELNGNWYPWSVTSGNVGYFKTAWARWYGLVQRELVAKGRNAKVVLNLNSDMVNRMRLSDMLPAGNTYDIVGVDFYSMWPDLTTQALWDANRLATKSDGSPRGIEAWRRFAASVDKPISFPEWGVNPQQRSDNAFFVQKMWQFFAANAPVSPYAPTAGTIAGEAWFNTWATCQIFPTTQVPAAAAMYASLPWGQR